MKICLINNLYKPLARGGAEKVVEVMAEELINLGHQVFIITTKPPGLKLPLTSGNPPVYYINSLYYSLKTVSKFFRLFWHAADMFDIASYRRVKAMLEKELPSLVITHNLKGMGYLTPLAIKSLNIKHLHYLHDIQLIHPSGLMRYGQENQVDTIFCQLYGKISSWLFRAADTVVSPTAWLMDWHASRGFFKKSRKVVLPNLVSGVNDSRAARTINAAKKRTDKPFTFLFLGQIEEHKGILFLLDAFKRLLRDHKNRELVIAGNGSALAKAKILAGESQSIKFLGWQNQPEFENQLLATSACLIVPSLCYENSPTVITKAWQFSLPIIAADLGGISELLEHGRGVLFKPGDVEDLTAKMSWAISNPEKLKEIGRLGAETTKDFSSKILVEKIISL